MNHLLRALMLVLLAAGALVLPVAEQIDVQAAGATSDVEDGEHIEDELTELTMLFAVGPAVGTERREPLWSYDGEGERDALAARLERPPRRS